MVYCAGKLIENFKLFYKSNRPQFLWVYGVITQGGCWENTRKACKSRAFNSFEIRLFTEAR